MAGRGCGKWFSVLAVGSSGKTTFHQPRPTILLPPFLDFGICLLFRGFHIIIEMIWFLSLNVGDQI